MAGQKPLISDQRGITGLETAIILIAFVVVASVFAFTVLSTGIFSSERSKETVFSGILEARSTLEPRGSVIAFAGKIDGATSTVFKISFIVSNAVSGEPIDLTPGYTADGSGDDPDIASGNEQATVISYNDAGVAVNDLPWTVNFLGDDDGDFLLEGDEIAEITAWLLTRDHTVTSVTTNDSLKVLSAGISSLTDILGANDKFTLEIKPPSGAVINLKRTLPVQLDTVMDLN
ncbi:MAG: hypothetical protein IH868_05060 [Chloroflexi bacterium]|nr:hypothetical protein [Chloroflexota bacterium]MCH8222765.1 hypothetical protein [Chloroflexota bacterium]